MRKILTLIVAALMAVPATEARAMIRNTVTNFTQYISVIEEELTNAADDNW